MIIDNITGNMNFDKFIIHPHMLYVEFAEKIPKEDVLTCDVMDTISVLLKPIKCRDYIFLIRLYFNKENQSLMLAQIATVENGEKITWEDWDYNKEIERKIRNDKWLLEEINKTNCNYKWGSIKSVYNSLEGSSYVIIKYN